MKSKFLLNTLEVSNGANPISYETLYYTSEYNAFKISIEDAVDRFSDQQLNEFKKKLKEQIEREPGILTKGLVLLTIDTVQP